MNVTVNGVITGGRRRLLRRRRQEGTADQCRDRGDAARCHDVRSVHRDPRFQAVRADYGRRHAPLEAGRGRVDLAPADGKYYVQVRESSYGGDGNCYYRLHVGNFPRPIAVYPAGGKMGEQVAGALPGRSDRRHREEGQAAQPADCRTTNSCRKTRRGLLRREFPFRLTSHGNVLEKEPNNSHQRGHARRAAAGLERHSG